MNANDSNARPDRRPLLYAIAGVLILALAVFLFRPQGGAEDLPETLVLTPTQAEDALHAAVEEGETDAETGTTEEEVTPTEEAASSAETVELDEDPFPAEDAKLETDHAKTTPPQPRTTQRAEVTATPVPRLTGSHYLVVGSFGDPQNAQRTVNRLDRSGVPAEIQTSSGKDGTVHRVRVGYFKNREDAEVYGRKLKQDMGLNYWIATR